MRQPFYAGVLYPKTENTLRRAIEEAYEHEKGPGALPTEARSEPVKGILAPHSAITLSGPCTAWSYKALAESPPADVYIIAAYNLGQNASGAGMRTYSMPFGEIRVDQKLCQALTAKKHIRFADNFHEHDHAIEVQLPWLQHAIKPNVKILPLLLADDVDLKELAVDLKETLLDQGKKAKLILSAEFTHHGPAYTFLPFDPPVNKHVYEYDAKALSHLTNLDLQGFLDFCASGPCSIDAVKPLEFAFHFLKPNKILVEQYYTSADVTGDEKNIAAYASILFL